MRIYMCCWRACVRMCLARGNLVHTTAQQPANKRSVHAIISRRKRSKVLFNDAGFQIRKRLAAELYLALNGRPPVGDGRYGPLGAWSALRHAIAAVCPRHLYRLQNHEDCYQQGSYRARIFPEVAHSASQTMQSQLETVQCVLHELSLPILPRCQCRQLWTSVGGAAARPDSMT